MCKPTRICHQDPVRRLANHGGHSSGSSERVQAMHRELSARGVPFLVSPQAYAWNAYACYFTDPEDNLWEIYTWQQGGHPNLIYSGEQGPQ